MSDYIAPLILLIVLFVGFGLVHRGKKRSGGCGGGCSGSCSGKPKCENADKPDHQ
jgi:hypothetical protein